MRDFILINYGYDVKKIYNNYFFYNNEKIYIVKLNNNIEYINDMFNLTNYLYSKKIFVSTFLYNKKGEYYCKKENEYIILLKINDRDNYISLNYLKQFQNINSNLKEINLLELYKQEIDDIELKMVDFNKEHKLLQNSINYFIGCAENAIQLLSEYNYIKFEDIGHLIKYYDYTKENFNDFRSFIKVNKMYDIANYIKYNFYHGNIDYDEIYNIIKNIDNEYEEMILFSCLLYNNFYFDIVNLIIDNKVKDDKLNIFIDSINEYEKLLIFCKQNMHKCKWINLINWFN